MLDSEAKVCNEDFNNNSQILQRYLKTYFTAKTGQLNLVQWQRTLATPSATHAACHAGLSVLDLFGNAQDQGGIIFLEYDQLEACCS